MYSWMYPDAEIRFFSVPGPFQATIACFWVLRWSPGVNLEPIWYIFLLFCEGLFWKGFGVSRDGLWSDFGGVSLLHMFGRRFLVVANRWRRPFVFATRRKVHTLCLCLHIRSNCIRRKLSLYCLEKNAAGPYGSVI